MKNLDFLKQSLIAHRGLHNEKYPENSIPAFKKAIEKNYIIELDVHVLKDNKIIVFHDDNLKRMTGIDKKIKDLTYDEIKDIKLLNTNYNIPLFIDVLKLIDTKVPVIIELKYDVKVGKLERKIVKILDNYQGKFVIKSFNPFSVYWFRLHRNNYIRGLLVGNRTDTITNKILHSLVFLNLCKPDFISCQKSMYKNKKINKFKNNHMVIAWTITNEKSYNKYINKYDNLICENMEVLKWKN